MNDFTSFLGTGWKFPPTFDANSRDVKMSSDDQDIHESLQILLSTRLGERIMEPSYGCNLENLLFAPLNLTTKTFVADQVKTAILYHEPRIDVLKVDITQGDDLKGELLIVVDYRIRSTNSRKNLVYPFYKNEGSEI